MTTLADRLGAPVDGDPKERSLAVRLGLINLALDNGEITKESAEQMKQEAKELASGPQVGETWESKETGLKVIVERVTRDEIFYSMPQYNGAKSTVRELFISTMRKS
jgi:hypothetical protein